MIALADTAEPVWKQPVTWPDPLPVTFTEWELTEWPALALLAVDLPAPPAPPAALTMPANRLEGDAGGGMVCSGTWHPDMSLALVWALALRHGLPNLFAKVSPADALETLRACLDGRPLDAFERQALREGLRPVVNHLNSLPLVEGFVLALGEEIHDLDLEAVEPLPAAPPRRAAPMAAPPAPTFTAEQAGEIDKPATDETAGHVAWRTLLLAHRHGLRLPGRLGGLHSGATRLTSSYYKEIHAHLPDALELLGRKAAPEGYGFAFERGRLLLRPLGAFLTDADSGMVVTRPDHDHGAEYVALQVLLLARWYGRRLDGKWVRRAWTVEYDPETVWADLAASAALFDHADAALDWINDSGKLPAGMLLDLDRDDNLTLLQARPVEAGDVSPELLALAVRVTDHLFPGGLEIDWEDALDLIERRPLPDGSVVDFGEYDDTDAIRAVRRHVAEHRAGRTTG